MIAERVEAHEMARALFLLAASLCAACATRDAGRAVAEGDLATALSRDVSGDRPILAVTITNRSRNQVCIRADTLQNPETHQMAMYLYDARGREVSGWEGFALPPIEGSVRLEPGETVRGQYYLDSLFRLRGNGRPFPRGMSAKVSIPYSHCDDVWALATSTRQPI